MRPGFGNLPDTPPDKFSGKLLGDYISSCLNNYRGYPVRRHSPGIGPRKPRAAARLVIWLLPLLLLGACTLQPTDTSTNAREWELRGKLGFRSPAQSGSALINWQQRGDDYRIHLSGPLGARAVNISGRVPGKNSAGHATFREAGKPPRHSDDVASLLQELLGWQLPVESALHWVRGQALDNGAASTSRDENGELTSISEAGWTVDYLAFGKQTGASAQRLPAKLRLSRGDLRLTLIIKQWRAPRPLQ